MESRQDMQPNKKQKQHESRPVNIGISSRALFILEEEHKVFREGGLEAYIKLQREREDDPMAPGSAFPFIKALEHVNGCLRKIDPKEKGLFNIVLMSHNNAQCGVRIIKSINYHDLHIERMCLTNGASPLDYLEAYNIDLFLSSYEDEVEQALSKGFAAAVMSTQKIEDPIQNQLRVAFDLDAVLFSDQSERIFQAEGLEAFQRNETERVDEPLPEGPLKKFAEALGKIQLKIQRHADMFDTLPMETYIITSRGAASSGERAIKTLRSWGMEVGGFHLLSGAPKGPIVKVIKPHIFFDDHSKHIASAQDAGTPAAHVRHGVANAQPASDA